MLYDRNWDRQRIIDLFGVIDWMMRIPDELQRKLMHNIAELEKERGMPYMNCFERAGLERGRREGRQERRREGREEMLREQLIRRFGTLPDEVDERIAKAQPSQLKAWSMALLDAPTLESVFKQR